MAHASEILDQIRVHGLDFCEVPVTIRYSAATLAKGRPFCGLALRFGDTAIWFALVDGDWVTDEATLTSQGYEIPPWFTDEFTGPRTF